jgi:hypothetical protein
MGSLGCESRVAAPSHRAITLWDVRRWVAVQPSLVLRGERELGVATILAEVQTWVWGFGRYGLGVDAEAEHHSALVVFGDVAVRHPETGVGHVEEDVDGFACAHENGVFPDEIGLEVSSRLMTRKRPAPWKWKGWCIGWSESISLTSLIFT